MKKNISILALLVLLFASFSGCSKEEKVVIKEPVLAEELKERFDSRRAAFTEAELASVYDLTLEYQGTADLQEIVYLPNLEILDITCGDDTNLSVLEDMDSLEYLYISNMSIESLGKLPALKSIKVLSLYNTETTSVEGMGNFPNLNELYILGSIVTDAFDYEEELGRLKVAEIGMDESAEESNRAAEISFWDAGVEAAVRITVKNMTQPITQEQLHQIEAVVLMDETVESVKDLTKCENLKSVMLWNTQVTDFSPLLEVTALTEIIIYAESEVDYSALYESEQIKRLCINGEWVKEK